MTRDRGGKTAEKLTRYSVEVEVNRPLLEIEKTRLMLSLSDAIQKALGDVESGTVIVYSEVNSQGHTAL